MSGNTIVMCNEVMVCRHTYKTICNNFTFLLKRNKILTYRLHLQQMSPQDKTGIQRTKVEEFCYNDPTSFGTISLFMLENVSKKLPHDLCVHSPAGQRAGGESCGGPSGMYAC